ncbi:MAG: hypothetical protein UHO61_05920 [Acutalibacteraceae bacterium]|nr:hypothetical protein [Acutalibacteraceae bacterium]
MSIIRVKSASLLRRDTAENWKSENPVLRQGEEGYETDTGRRKVGDGVSDWNSLSYTVDQTYNPDSVKAQSGKAVEKAIAAKLDNPENAPEVGKTLLVKSVNNDGTFTCEWGTAVSDSIVKGVMCDGKGDAWTDAERLAALLCLGCTVDENGFVKWTAQEG